MATKRNEQVCQNCQSIIDNKKVEVARAVIPSSILMGISISGKCGLCMIDHAQSFCRLVGGVMEASNKFLKDIANDPPKKDD